MDHYNPFITQIESEQEKFRLVTDPEASCANDAVTPHMKDGVKLGLSKILNQLAAYPALQQQGKELIQAIDDLTYEDTLVEIAPKYQQFMDTLLEELK